MSKGKETDEAQVVLVAMLTEFEKAASG